MAKNPWKRLFNNVMLSATYGSHGARSKENPKFSGREYHRNAANSSQSTRRHEVEITWEDLENQYKNQNGKCYWFDLPLDPMDVFISRYPLAMSVDRISNEKGYMKDNILITCRLANLGRQSCDIITYKDIIEKIKNHLLR